MTTLRTIIAALLLYGQVAPCIHASIATAVIGPVYARQNRSDFVTSTSSGMPSEIAETTAERAIPRRLGAARLMSRSLLLIALQYASHSGPSYSPSYCGFGDLTTFASAVSSGETATRGRVHSIEFRSRSRHDRSV